MFKYIVVPSCGEEADAGAFSTALVVARLSAAHMLFLYVQDDPRRLLTALTGAAEFGDGLDYPDMMVALEGGMAERRREAERGFSEFCQREGLTSPGVPSQRDPSAEWRVEIGDQAPLVAEYGRAADLVVIGRGADGGTRLDLLQAALMATGRPVLIAPSVAPARLTGTVAIAWKNCPEAARAVAAARPFIEMADRVIIFQVEEGIDLGEESCTKLRDALCWHNPHTTVQRLERDDRAPVEALMQGAGAAQADLLVMGGYGHSRVREVVFGGFTRRVLNSADLPVLMTH